MFTSRALALHAARLASDKGAEDIRVLHLPEGGGTVFDYVVLASARSDRQTDAVVEEVYHFCKRHSVPRHPIEGEGGWMLIDCFDVVVHACTTEMRERYLLDSLWTQARDVKWEAEAKRLDDPDRPEAAKPKGAKRRPAAPRAARIEGEADELPALPPELPKRRSRLRPAPRPR